MVRDGMVYAASRVRPYVAIKPGGHGDVSASHVVWKTQNGPDVPTPVSDGKLLWVVNDRGIMWCFDAKTGKKNWSQEYGDPFYASAVYADGKVYITDMSGKTHIVKATKDYQLLGTPELGEKAVCSPVFTDGKVYIRGMNQLFCFGSK